MHHLGNLVQIVSVVGRDNRLFLHIGEQRNFLALLLRQRLLGAAHQNVRLYTDRTQFLDRVLRRLGLDLRRRRDVGHQRQVHVHDAVVPELHAHLANRFQERQRLDIADRAADLDEANVGIAGALLTPVLISSVMCGMTCTVAPR